ncbi:MAG: mechanosensitive ion channel family protein [Balneolales bacterium]|nr:mechanosensitive ion channel family protein [Balneolales bacterium]
MTPEFFTRLSEQVASSLGTSVGFSDSLLQSAAVIVVLLLVRYLFLIVVYWQSKSPQIHYNYKRYSAQVAFVMGVFLIGKIWFEGFQSLATFLGLLSVGLALALRELLTDLAGWLYIVVRKPFEMGDRIEVAGVKGDVIDKRLFTFSVIEVGSRVGAEQSTGRIIHIPNNKVFTDTVANYTSGFPYIWHEIPVNITFESNHTKARSILLEITNETVEVYVEEARKSLQQAQESFMLKFNILTPAVFVSVGDNGVRLTARYLSPVRKTRATEQEIWLQILERFQNEKDIHFAYHTVRVRDIEKQDGSKP